MNTAIKERISTIRQGKVPDGWGFCHFGDKFERITRKNKVGNNNVLTISAQQGLINQFEYYNHQYASENTEGYTLINKGEFAYNKSYSGDYLWGAIKRLDRYESGIVSPLYICFSPKENTCAEFYIQYFEGGRFNREIYKIAQEGARNHGLLNVSTEDFFNTTLASPPLAEQEKIAEILGCCDRVIALKKGLIAEKKKQKKSLMQKLLNPNSSFRLPGFLGKWKEVKLGEICEIRKGTQINGILLNEIGTYYALNGGFEPSGYCEKWNVEKNTISISEGGNSCGYINYNKENFWSGGHCYTLHNLKNINSLHLFMALKYNELAIMALRVGSGLPNIQKKTLSNFKIWQPATEEEQQAIAEILSAADREIDLLEQDLALWQTKKKSLMQLLLTGIVRVKI